MSIEYIILITLLSIPFMLFLFMLFAKIHYKYHNKVLHAVLGVIFSVLNFLTNAWTVSIIGLQLPKQATTTARLKEWKQLSPDTNLNKWRIAFATKICQILNRYDPNHC